MNYEPARDPSELIHRLLKASCKTEANTANELARLRSQYGASHEQVEALLQLASLRQEQAVAGSTEMVVDETCRQHEETRGLQMQQASEICDILQHILQEQRDLKVAISNLGQTIFPRLPKGYGPTGPYRLVPGEEFKDPEHDLDEVVELTLREGEIECW